MAMLPAISYCTAMYHFFLVFLGGGIGATARHLVGIYSLRNFGPNFPYGTLMVNVAGSLIMGLFIGWLVRREVSSSNELRLFVATGVLGGFTTFSAFSLDVANLWEKGALMPAAIYTIGTVLVCILAVFAGLWLARSLAA